MLLFLSWIEMEDFTSPGGLPVWPALGLKVLGLAAGAAAALLVPIPALRLGRLPAVLGLVLLMMGAGLGLGLVLLMDARHEGLVLLLVRLLMLRSMAPSLVVVFLVPFVLGFGIGLLFPLTFWRQLKRLGPGKVRIPVVVSVLASVVWWGGGGVVFVIVAFQGSKAGLIAVAVVGLGLPWLLGLWRVLVSPVVGHGSLEGSFRPPKISVSRPR
jgi:hypothetical protein